VRALHFGRKAVGLPGRLENRRVSEKAFALISVKIKKRMTRMVVNLRVLRDLKTVLGEQDKIRRDFAKE
jgi:hypothetical protein